MFSAKSWNCSGVIWAILCACVVGKALVAQVPAKVDFARDIRPIFREHCLECHGPSQQMRGFRLDRRRDALPNRVGANGARIVPGNSSDSLLYLRVSTAQPGKQMPPSGPLRPEQIGLVKQWIDQGAEWPDSLSGERQPAPPNPAAIKIRNALRNGDRSELGRLVRGTPGAANAKGPGGWTPIMYAALYGDAEAVGLLLTEGASPNAQNDDGGTALIYAIDSEDKTKLLLDRGADPNLRSGEGRTALAIAAGRAGCYPVVKLLLDRGADARIEPADGRGILIAAVGSTDPKVFQLLLDHGAARKNVPLGPALISGCTACFDLLLPLADRAGLTGGLHGAVRTGDISRIQILLDRGAKPDALLLQTVAASPSVIPTGTIQSLISQGADVNAKTSFGVSMIDFAKRHENATLVQALTQAGVSAGGDAPPELRRKPAESARAAMERVLPLLQRADAAFFTRGGCVSCHNNSLTAMTIGAARAKGVKYNDQIAKDQSRRIAGFLQENAERALENEGLPGSVDTVSYILLGLAADGYPSDPITDVWSRFVKNNQSSDGRWVCIAARPPLESSDFEVTAASIRALKTYRPKSQEADFERAVARGVHWLEAATPTSTEDVAFKILGLTWGGGSQTAIRAAGQELLARQAADGGWSQTKALRSDAYATGQALVALKESKAIPTGDRAYQRGVQYLLNSQLEDGSWYVQSRAPAFQPYFDSDFPHGPDQFISAAASNWASMALATVVR